MSSVVGRRRTKLESEIKKELDFVSLSDGKCILLLYAFTDQIQKDDAKYFTIQLSITPTKKNIEGVDAGGA